MVGRYRPGDARQFVGQRAGHHIGVTSRQQRAHPVSQGALLVLQSLHVNPGTLNQQPSEILVTTLADPHQIGFSAGAVLPGYQANRRRKVTAASVLLAIAHFHSQQAGGDRPNTRYAQQTPAQIIVGKLANQLFIQRLDLFIQLDKVIVQTL